MLASLGYAIWRTRVYPANSEFAGLFYVILTFPWSVVLLLVALALELALERMRGAPLSLDTTEAINLSLLFAGALVNAYLLYRVGERRPPGSRER